MTIVALANQKGGVAKTTTTIQPSTHSWPSRRPPRPNLSSVTNYAFDTPSYQEIGNNPKVPLNRLGMEWFWDKYLKSPADGSNPYASPLRAKSLKGLPPATLITADIDPLRSEGQAYAQRLRTEGVSVKATNYTNVTHDFFGMGAVVNKAKQAVQQAATGLFTNPRP